MLIKISHVDVSKAGSGRNQYEIAEVTYSAFGKVKTFKVVSFANPQVFKTISNAKPGEEFNVTVTKNDRGYDQWSEVEVASGKREGSESSASVTAPPARFGGDRETKDEREARQRYIIRQSSLSNAVALLTVGAKSTPKLDEVKELAEELVKFVYAAPTVADAEKAFEPSLAEMDDDIPF